MTNDIHISELDKKIIRALQGDMPIIKEPYKEIASSLGISEEYLLARIESMLEDKTIRKLGAVLRHREVGYKANVLCVWNVPSEEVYEVATGMSNHPQVSHCYERERADDWQYNLYTMIHGFSREECEDIANKLGNIYNIADRVMLYTVKEWKKTSMKYFHE